MDHEHSQDPVIPPSAQAVASRRRRGPTQIMLLAVAVVTVLIGIACQERAAKIEHAAPTRIDEPEEAREAARHAASGVGRPAPAFALETLGPATLSPMDFRGHPVIVLFWATWCEPCVEGMPILAQLQEQLADDGLIILGVNVGESRVEVEAFSTAHDLPFPLLLDQRAEASNRYRVIGVPSTFFIDREGILRAQFFGPIANADLERLVPAILDSDDP
jgi:thiol-disulfide isomerase/thioredoxin